MIVIDKIIGLVKEGLVLYGTHLEKKKELYELHLTKKRKKALNIAEESFTIVREIFNWIYENMPMDKDQLQEFNKLKKAYYKKKDKFDKMD